MGDLIRKLPTDDVQLSKEEKENFILLFGEEEEETISPPPPIRTATPIPENPKRPLPVPTTMNPSPAPVLLKKELFQVAILSGLFFFFNLSLVDSLFQNYIPLCKSSEITRTVIKSVVFGIALWVLINFRYIQK